MHSQRPESIIGISLTIEVLACIVSLFMGAAGYGAYVPAVIFFPLTMLSTYISTEITKPFIIVALVQFPIYGIILALAKYMNKLKIVGSCLAILHVVMVLVAIFFTDQYFNYLHWYRQ